MAKFRPSSVARGRSGCRAGASAARSRLPAPYARLGMLSVVLPACAPEPCPKGSVRNVADDLCYLLDDDDPTGGEADGGGEDGGDGGSGDGGGSGGEGTGGDDSGTVEPVVVVDGCDAPSELPDDPITDLGAFHLQSRAFAEAVDIELDVAGGVAVLAGQAGLMLVDISDEGDPTWIGHHGSETMRQRYQNIELLPGGLVYATNWDLGLGIYDVVSGPDPVLNRTVEVEGLAGMALQGSVMHIVDKRAGELLVYDVSDPGNPGLLTSVSGLAAPFAPFLSGDRLYVADNSLGIVVFDVSDPELPVVVGEVFEDASIQDLAFSPDGGTLYAAAGGAGVQVYSLDDPDAPALVDTIELPYSVLSVATGDGLLWAVDQQDIVAVDIGDPRVPVVLNSHETGQWSMHVAAAGTRAWVADWGYIRGYLASGAPVGDVDPSTGKAYIAPGESLTLTLANAGGADAIVSGVSVSDARVSWSIDDGRIPAGGSQALTLTFDGDESGLDATVCIASDDPDSPIQEVALVSTEDGGRAGVGVEAPDFSLQDLDGNTHRLSDLRGRPVVLAYFATW